MEHFIITYGYLAIFLLVFLQEIGIPNPVSNELVLIFSGSLAYSHTLSLPLILLSAISADIIGTTVLYTVFYFFGNWILSRKWLPECSISNPAYFYFKLHAPLFYGLEDMSCLEDIWEDIG